MKNLPPLPHINPARLAIRIILSLALGAVLAFTVGWVKLAVHDKPVYRAGLADCFKDPLCDPSPYITMGWPYTFGVNNDQTGSLRVMALSNSAEEYDGGVYTDDYWGFAGDTLLFAVLAFAGLTARQLLQHFRRRRRSRL